MRECDSEIVEAYVLFRRLCLMLEVHVDRSREASMSAVEQAYAKGGPVGSASSLPVFKHVALVDPHSA